jgi:hypothetical protein
MLSFTGIYRNQSLLTKINTNLSNPKECSKMMQIKGHEAKLLLLKDKD